MSDPPSYYSVCKFIENPDCRVCSISLNMTDRIRLIGVPPEMTEVIRDAILTGWENGIQGEKDNHGAYEFKLHGNPWAGGGCEAVSSRRLLTHLLTCMASQGWNLLQSSDVSKKQQDKDTLFFESCEPDPDAQLFSLSFNMTDRIRVIDAPNMMTHVKKAVEGVWKKGIQKEQEYHGAMELKLSGTPWWADGEEAVHTRILLNEIISNLRRAEYKLYGSVDVNMGVEGRDLETWVFRKVGPVWH